MKQFSMPVIRHGDSYYFNSYQCKQSKRPRHFLSHSPGGAGA